MMPAPIHLFSRRKAIAGAVGGLMLAGCDRGSGNANRIEDVTLRVATYKGQVDSFFAAAGESSPRYHLAPTIFAGGGPIIEAINAGAIDVGQVSEIPPIFVAAAQPRLRLVAVQQNDTNGQMVLVPPNSPIRSAAGLRGKRIGYVRATTSQYILLRVLDKAGLTLADITPVALSLTDGLAAFRQRQLDAWVTFGMPAFLARGDGAHVLMTGTGILSGNYVIVVSTDALEDPLRRQAILDYLGKVARTWSWVARNKEAWAIGAERDTGVSAEIWRQQINEWSVLPRLLPVTAAAIASQQQIADRFAAAGMIPDEVDVRPPWDMQLNDGIGSIQYKI